MDAFSHSDAKLTKIFHSHKFEDQKFFVFLGLFGQIRQDTNTQADISPGGCPPEHYRVVFRYLAISLATLPPAVTI